MKTKIFFIATLFCMNCFAQELFNDSLLKEDFNILTNIVCEVSPNLNLKEKKALYSYLNNRSQKLNGKTMSTIDFFRFLMDTKANTKLDEHGAISLSNKVMKTLLTDKKVLFPLPIIISDNKLIINHENVQIPFGSSILKINGVSTSNIIESLLREKSTFALRNLEQSFDIFYLLKYGIPKTYDISYTLPNSDIIKTITLFPVDIKTRENIYSKIIYPLNPQQYKNITNTSYFKDIDTYYIQLNSFYWRKNTTDIYNTFNKHFSLIFKKIKKQKAKNLIIDLRYNKGGNMMIPALFYSYISRDNFNEYMSLTVPDFKLPYKNHIVRIVHQTNKNNEVDHFINDFKKHFKKNRNYYENVFINNIKRQKNKRSFKGNVYLLVGGRTFSAAAYYTALFKNYKRGIIIGEQVGGSHHNITAGKQIEYVLPNTKIIVSVPMGLLKFSQEIEKNIPELKITPDVQPSTEYQYQSLIKKEDWDLETVLNIIKKNNQH